MTTQFDDLLADVLDRGQQQAAYPMLLEEP
jgi:hypothetical protein